MSKFKMILQQTVLNYKFIFMDRMMMLLLLGFYFMPILICLFVIPFRFIISLVFIISALLPSTLFYISRSYAWKTGSINQQLKTADVSGVVNNISLFIFYFINVYMLSFIVILTFHILGISNLLIENWLGGRMHDYNNVIKLFKISMMYSIFEMTIVMYAIVYFLMKLVKSYKVMYIIIMTLMILDVIYGATFNNYYRDIGKLNVDQVTGEFEDGVVFFSRNLFPEFFYYPTVFLFPLYGPSQHMATQKFVIDGYEEFKFFDWSSSSDVITYWHSTDTLTIGCNAFKWNVLWFVPYIHFSCLVTGGIVVDVIKKEA